MAGDGWARHPHHTSNTLQDKASLQYGSPATRPSCLRAKCSLPELCSTGIPQLPNVAPSPSPCLAQHGSFSKPTWNSCSSCLRSRCSLSRLARLHTVPSRACFSLSQCSCFSRRFCSAVAACSSALEGRCRCAVGERGTTQLAERPSLPPSTFFLPSAPGGGGGGGGGGPAKGQRNSTHTS